MGSNVDTFGGGGGFDTPKFGEFSANCYILFYTLAHVLLTMSILIGLDVKKKRNIYIYNRLTFEKTFISTEFSTPFKYHRSRILARLKLTGKLITVLNPPTRENARITIEIHHPKEQKVTDRNLPN